MRTRRKPIHREGVRNALCPNYRKCLDLAVRKAWEFWDCGECSHKADIDPELNIEATLNQNVAYYDVPMEISIKI